jgi:hypothetical protein
MEDPEALPLDYDNDAFKRRIRYLAQAQQTEEAELLEQHRREVIYRGACSAFLLIAEDLIKRNLRPQAETYIQWVIDRGSSKQRQRAEALA